MKRSFVEHYQRGVELQGHKFEQFTDRSRTIIRLANEEAICRNHPFIGTEHILLGLAKESEGIAGHVLKNLDVDLEKLRTEVSRFVEDGTEKVAMKKLPLTPLAKQVIDFAIREAHALNHHYIGTEHLLLGVLRVPNGVAVQALFNLGIQLKDVRKEVLKLLGQGDFHV